jgi:hypothetical protein
MHRSLFSMLLLRSPSPLSLSNHLTCLAFHTRAPSSLVPEISHQDPPKPKQLGEYWFVAGGGAAKVAGQRIKLVNTEDYHVSKPREGWLQVKDRGTIKDRWVVLRVCMYACMCDTQENTLFVYKDADTPAPLLTIADIDSYEVTLKKGINHIIVVPPLTMQRRKTCTW